MSPRSSVARRRSLLTWGLCAVALLVPRRALAGLEELIVAAKPSVVAVGVFNPTSSPRFGFRGSGFVVGPGNLVVTNAHVLPDVIPAGGTEGSLAVVVPTPGGSESAQVRSASLLGLDREHDLALLRIDGAPLPPLPLAEPARAREGASVAIIGFPIGGALGFTPVTHRGIVSSITAIALPAPERAVAELPRPSIGCARAVSTSTSSTRRPIPATAAARCWTSSPAR